MHLQWLKYAIVNNLRIERAEGEAFSYQNPTPTLGAVKLGSVNREGGHSKRAEARDTTNHSIKE